MTQKKQDKQSEGKVIIGKKEINERLWDRKPTPVMDVAPPPPPPRREREESGKNE